MPGLAGSSAGRSPITYAPTSSVTRSTWPGGGDCLDLGLVEQDRHVEGPPGLVLRDLDRFEQ
jgi:hypothetical protein